MICNGLYGSTEDEFLQYCEAGLCVPPPLSPTFLYDPHTQAHLLVGIEPTGLEQLDKKQPLEEIVWSRDPRFANLIQSTRLLSSTADAGVSGPEQGEGGSIADRIRTNVSKFLYVPLDEVEGDGDQLVWDSYSG